MCKNLIPWYQTSYGWILHCPSFILIVIYDTNMMLCFVSGHSRLENLTSQAMARLNTAFRPPTQAAYTSMFRVFVAFCVYMKVAMVDVHVGVLLAFLECLHVNKVSVHMVCNYLSAIKAKFICLGYPLWH